MHERFFFFQAEDGIRDGHVTGVQTCALPILEQSAREARGWINNLGLADEVKDGVKGFKSLATGGINNLGLADEVKIGRAACRERVENWEVAVWRDMTAKSTDDEAQVGGMSTV